jgi:ABC-type transporter Mla maintaining outer membrane lipid asymmetry ATPase subunit MlaF
MSEQSQNEHIISCNQLIPEGLPFEYTGEVLNLYIDRGEVISIIGPDYSGKGNWLRTICGLEDPRCGEIYINGLNILKLSSSEWTKIRKKVAYLHEDTALLSAASGLMNVMLPAIYHQMDKNNNRQLLKERAQELLETIDPDIELDILPAYLSKDHQYKIAIARALLLEPDVLALNNPFAHFNPGSKQRFQHFLDDQVKHGLSLLLVTHDIPYALTNSDKIIFASRENLIFFDSPQAIKDCDLAVFRQFIDASTHRYSTSRYRPIS